MTQAHNIDMALHRIQSGRPHIVRKDRKLSISLVAEEAGIHASTIHNHYPAIAEKIRVLANKGMKAQRDEIRNELKRLKAENKALRLRLEQFSHYAKYCPKCDAVKPLYEFYQSERYGLQWGCKACRKTSRR